MLPDGIAHKVCVPIQISNVAILLSLGLCSVHYVALHVKNCILLLMQRTGGLFPPKHFKPLCKPGNDLINLHILLTSCYYAFSFCLFQYLHCSKLLPISVSLKKATENLCNKIIEYRQTSW